MMPRPGSSAKDELHRLFATDSELPKGTELAPGLFVIKRIGQGGQGEVYEVEGAHGRSAIKLLLPEYEKDSAILTRLMREAATASLIRHPNVIRIDGLEDSLSGRKFIRMELLDGYALETLLAAGPLPIERAIELTRQIASGLEAIHAQGIVHRDLKPSNIFIVDDGGKPLVKIMDFGIAKPGAAMDATQVTQTGTLVGSPTYMSPEQASSPTDVDSRADQYSLGVILFHMLTGRPPFPGDQVGQVLIQHATQAPPNPRSIRPEVPQALAAFNLRLLRKRPEERFASTTELLQKLESAIASTARVRPAVVDRRSEAVSPQANPVLHALGSVSESQVSNSRRMLTLLSALVGGALIAVAVFAPLPQESPHLARKPREGRLEITSTPEGAQVIIAGQKIDRDEPNPITPCAIELPAGRLHDVLLRKDGYRDRRAQVRIARIGDIEKLDVTLEALPAKIEITVRGENASFASVQVNGSPVGRGSFQTVTSPAGPVTIEAVVDPPGCKGSASTVVGPGERSLVDVVLECP